MGLMQMVDGIQSIIFSYVISIMGFNGARLQCCGIWAKYPNKMSVKMTIIPPDPQKSDYAKYPNGKVIVNGKDCKIERWFNNYTFLLCDHRSFDEVIFCLSHALYEVDIKKDVFVGNIQWELQKKHEDADSYKCKRYYTAESIYRLKPTKWKNISDDENKTQIIEIKPDPNSAYGGTVIFDEKNNEAMIIGFWYHDHHCFAQSDCSYVELIFADSGELYEKRMNINNVYKQIL